MIDMQMQLCANMQQKTDEARHESERARVAQAEIKREEDAQAMARAEKEILFNKYFKLGSTAVFKQLGKYYFSGDISHNEQSNIFHNARAIMHYMQKSGKSYGHMNYNDPPTYGDKPKWHDWNRERRYLYKEHLFMFDEDEQPVKADDGLGEYFDDYENESKAQAWKPDTKY